MCIQCYIEAGASVYIFHIVRSTELRLHWYKFYKELAKIRVQIPHAVKMNNNNNSCTKWDMKNDEKKSTNAHNRVLCELDGCAGSSLFTHTHIIVHNIYIYYMRVRILTYFLRGWICNILFRFEFYRRSCREEENKYKPIPANIST